jgi:hypothetical protein
MIETSNLEDPQAQSLTPPSGKPSISDVTPQTVAIAISALGVVAAFCAPWVSSNRYISGAGFYSHDHKMVLLWIIPASALATLFFNKNKVARAWFSSITLLATFLGIAFLSLKMMGTARFAWGEQLTVLFALGLFAFAGDRRLTAPVDLVARKISSRKADVFSHSFTLAPGVHFSTQEFYGIIESDVRDKQWPGVELVRVYHSETAVLSHKREYLRIIRERQLFDVCGSTFGKDYFFSVREAAIPAIIDIRAFLVLMMALAFLLFVSVRTFGFFFGPAAMIFVLTFVAWFLFNALRLGLTRVDSLLIQLPVLGPVYERWFRPHTYFHEDSRIAFLYCVTDLVKHHVEKVTSAKGLKFVKSIEKQPILDGLYRPSRTATKTSDDAPVTN